MIPYSEKERIRLLLKETLTLLCKNGLPYTHSFNIEALIGITLDEDDVLLISLNELIQGQNVVDQLPYPLGLPSRGLSGKKRGRPRGSMKARRSTRVFRQLHSEISSMPFDQIVGENDLNPLGDVNQDVHSDGSEDTEEYEEGKVNLDTTASTSTNLLAQIKSVVESGLKNTEKIVAPTSRSTGNLKPMAKGDIDRIWQSAMEHKRLQKSPDTAKTPKKKKKKGEGGETDITLLEPPAPPMCHICGITITCEKNLKKHIRRHLGMFSYSCEECGKGYFSRPDLDAHYAATHQQVKMFQCDLCGRSYSQKRGLNKHVKHFHNKAGPPGLDGAEGLDMDDSETIDDGGGVSQAIAMSQGILAQDAAISHPMAPQAPDHMHSSHLQVSESSPQQSSAMEMPQRPLSHVSNHGDMAMMSQMGGSHGNSAVSQGGMSQDMPGHQRLTPVTHTDHLPSSLAHLSPGSQQTMPFYPASMLPIGSGFPPMSAAAHTGVPIPVAFQHGSLYHQHLPPGLPHPGHQPPYH